MISKQEILSKLDIKNFYSSYLPSMKFNGSGMAQALCIFHNDSKPSLSVNLTTGQFKCFGCDSKGSIFDFYQKKHNADFKTALTDLARQAGISTEPQKKVVKTYNYTDVAGNLFFQVIRYEPKGFLQRRPDGKGEWIYNLKDVRLVPYNLPELIKADSVIIVEGEKDVETLKVIGITATCNPMGAGKWRPEYNQYFKGKKIAIIPDNDEPGKNHALQVAKNLKGIAESVKIIDLPDLKDKEDITDFLKSGGTKEKLIEIIEATPEWIPEKSSFQNIGMPLIKLGDLFKEPDAVVDYIIDGLLPAGGFSVIASKPKVGKSTLVRNSALSVAKGETFLDRSVNKGAVIYYALEEKRAEVKKHFRDMGADGTEEIYIYAGGATVDALKQIKKVAESLKPSLIVIDPLFRLTKIKDGNDYAQVTAALDPILRLARDTGAHVLCVHHTSKGDRQAGDSVLGSTAIFSSVDTLLIMKRHENYRTIQTVQRYGDDLEETTLHFDKDTRTVSIGQSKQDEDIGTIGESIIEFLKGQEEPVNEPAIMNEIEGRTGLKRKALRELVKVEKVLREGKGGKGDPYKYSCSLVPDTIWEQENENFKNELSPDNQKEYACTGFFAKNSEWEQAKDNSGTSKLTLQECPKKHAIRSDCNERFDVKIREGFQGLQRYCKVNNSFCEVTR